ncbi:MAG: hypothetical protein K2X94_05230 [Amoebophilaceae bacterium]|nr:hypothetical protein [Amoebophilaceae bacterium]MBY0244591.1 hypothetical protein [Sphingobacteriaceae bacterium]
MTHSNSIKKILITLITSALFACNGGGGGSSGGDTPSPTPSPSPSPTPSVLQALTITQTPLNIDKVGQHRIWTLTLTNPNSVPVTVSTTNLSQNYFNVDANTPIGPTNPIQFAMAGGNNNCLDTINKGLPLAANQSCIYKFNAMWAANESGLTDFSFNLTYFLRNTNNDMFYVQKNCSPIIIPPSATATPCATGTNAAIQYSLLNLTSKANIDVSLSPKISMDGTNMWTTNSNYSVNNRSTLSYNNVNNSLTVGQINYTYASNANFVAVNTSGLSAYSNGQALGDNSGALIDYNGNIDSGQNQKYGLDGIIYSGTYSKGINLPQYVYTVNQATNQITAPLPAPVAFAGLYSALYAVDKDSNIFGLNGNNDGTNQHWGCFTKNGAGYNNWTDINENGLLDFNPAVGSYIMNTTQGLYSQAKTDAFGQDKSGYCDMQSFFNGVCSNSITSAHLIDLNTCEVSKTNYLIDWNRTFISTKNYILVFTGSYYVLPSSKLSNGLNGQ